MRKLFDDIAYYAIYSWISVKIFIYKILVWFQEKADYYQEMKIKMYIDQNLKNK